MGGQNTRGGGSRFLYEPFDIASARLDASERISEERWEQLGRRLNHMEKTLDRLEKRMWLAVFGAASMVLANLAYAIITKTIS
jgi:hypothetical protein